MSERVTIISGEISLEGNLDSIPGDKGVVITHPHPLYGGDMNNNVVETIHNVYRNAGYTTLRFNFRGVGNSEGIHSQGTGETLDVQSSIDYIYKTGITHVHLAGYSFGAWINSMVDADTYQIKQMTMVSPPLAFIDFQTQIINCPIRAVTGRLDDYAPPGLVEPAIKKWNSDCALKIIDHTDHFYGGYIKKLESILEGFVMV